MGAKASAASIQAVAEGFSGYVKQNEVERARQRDAFLEDKAKQDGQQAAILGALTAASEELLEAAKKLKAERTAK